MFYQPLAWLEEKAWWPRPPRDIQHFIFMETDQDIDRVYHHMSGMLWEIRDDVREWLWFNIDGQTEPWVKFGRLTIDRRWAYDLASKENHKTAGCSGYVAFRTKADAMLFKLAWA